jgi:hypothetical protein
MFLIEFFKGESTDSNKTDTTMLSRKGRQPISKMKAGSDPRRMEEWNIQL